MGHVHRPEFYDDTPDYYNDLRTRIAQARQRTKELLLSFQPTDVDNLLASVPLGKARNIRLVEYQRLKLQHLWLNLLVRYGNENRMLKHMAPYITDLDLWGTPGGGPSHAYCMLGIEAFVTYQTNARSTWTAFMAQHWPALAAMITTCQTFFEMACPDKVLDVKIAQRVGQELHDLELSPLHHMESTHGTIP